MNKETKFTKGEWAVSREVNMNDITITVMTDKLSIIADRYVTDDPMHDAHLIKTAPKLYRFIESLQLSVSDEIERDELLAEARGEL